MLNLEEINLSEEELLNSYDPDNEENNYHLPNHLYKELQLKQYRNICSEIIPNELYLASYFVASDHDCLRRHQITHIVNSAADICDSRYPEQFEYLAYYLKDINHEEISLILYPTIEWISGAIQRGGRVLVHCREGVSRSSTIVLAYLMWRFNISFETAHDRVRKVRPICNPNTGFTCQLLVLGKKLGTSSQAAAATDKTAVLLFRIGLRHPKEPALLLLPTEMPSTWPLFDPRFAWVMQQDSQVILWLGSKMAADETQVRAAAIQHIRWLEMFERRVCTLVVGCEGSEPPELWQALGLYQAPAQQGLAATKQCFDQDFADLRLRATRTTWVDVTSTTEQA
jgi:protein-tyrosine phosphatase